MQQFLNWLKRPLHAILLGVLVLLFLCVCMGLVGALVSGSPKEQPGQEMEAPQSGMITPSLLPTILKVPSTPTPIRTSSKPESAQTKSVYYANCAAVRAAGKAPLYRGQPGYRSGLDRDGDGVACDR